MRVLLEFLEEFLLALALTDDATAADEGGEEISIVDGCASEWPACPMGVREEIRPEPRRSI